MEETPIEDKEAEGKRKIEEALEMRSRLYDQNQRLYNLEQERDRLIKENKSIEQKAKTDVKNLEEYIQQEANAVREKVKKFESTLYQQIVVIEGRQREIEKCYKDLKTFHGPAREVEEVTLEESRQVDAQGEKVARHELFQEEARQGETQEVSRQEVAQEGTGERETEENSSWEQQGRHRFHCPICGLGRRTKCQVEQHMNIHDKPEEDSQFNCKDCQFQTMNRDQLYQHMEMIHKKIECNLCNTFFNTRKNLNVHRHERYISLAEIFPVRIVSMTVNAVFTTLSLTRVISSALNVEIFSKTNPVCLTILKVIMDRKPAKDSKKINAPLVIGVFTDILKM